MTLPHNRTNSMLSIPENHWQPGNLWSLLDMLQLNAHKVIATIRSFEQWVRASEGNEGWAIEPSNIDYIDMQLSRLEVELEKLDLSLSIKQLKKIKGLLRLEGDYTATARFRNIAGAVEELKSRIEDELESKVLYCLSSREADFAKSESEPFGPIVAAKISCADDIEEARKCLAFGRYTASVFHLMRAMEVAVSHAGTALDATVLKKSGEGLEWGVIVANMSDKLRDMEKGEMRNNWSKTHAMLIHVKDAWRNPTMHPKDTYTEEQAHEVYAAVKGFMGQLAPLL